MRTLKNYIMQFTILCLVTIFGTAGFALQAAQGTAKTVGKKRLQLAKERSLLRAQKAQERSAGIDTRTLQEIEESTMSDRFTQTEAYFQIPELRKLVTEEFKGSFAVVQHMDVISRLMAKEAELRKTHWAFYHGLSNVWTVWQDAYTKLYNHFNPLAKKRSEDFIFLRVASQKVPGAQEFLVKELRENGLVDNSGDLKAVLLSTNLSLFGSAGVSGSSSWKYFMEEKNREEPDKADYKKIMDEFKLPYTYVDELMTLTKILESRQQALLQIFVPKDSIDDVGYISWAKGMPYHEASVNWIRENVKNKTYHSKKGREAREWAFEDLKDKFKKEQEKNPLFREMIQEAERGDYSVDAFLKIYCNKPWDLPHLNYVQARLVLSNDVLLDPTSGVKIFRYTGLKKAAMDEYEKRLDEIIKKIVAEKRAPAPAA